MRWLVLLPLVLLSGCVYYSGPAPHPYWYHTSPPPPAAAAPSPSGAAPSWQQQNGPINLVPPQHTQE